MLRVADPGGGGTRRAVVPEADGRWYVGPSNGLFWSSFSDRPPGAAFGYENSNGLAVIAVNQGRADRDLGLAIGIPVEIVS